MKAGTNAAASEAMRRSRRARERNPAPAAAPLTAAMTGFSRAEARSWGDRGAQAVRDVAGRLAELGQVLADAEAAPGAGEDDRAHAGARLLERRGERPGACGVEGVEDVGAVEGERQDGATGSRAVSTSAMAAEPTREPRPRARRVRSPSSQGLAALELGRTLLEERGQALLRVLRGERQVERSPLVLEPERQRGLERAVDRLLGQPDRDRRAWTRSRARPASPPRATPPWRRRARPALPRAPPAPEEAAAQDHVHRDRLPDRARQRCVPPAPGMIPRSSPAGRAARSPRRPRCRTPGRARSRRRGSSPRRRRRAASTACGWHPSGPAPLVVHVDRRRPRELLDVGARREGALVAAEHDARTASSASSSFSAPTSSSISCSRARSAAPAG